MHAPALERFVSSHDEDSATLATGPSRLERRRLGTVELSDGRVFACDPLVPMDQTPFARRVEAGVYEAVLFVAVGSSSEIHGRSLAAECNAAAALILGAGTPVRWTRALRDGGDDASGAYGVDAGTGCFMGSRAAESVFADNEAAGIEIASMLRESSGGVAKLDNGDSLAFFYTGDGDGVYESWWGHDAQGNVAMLLTDFDVVQSAEEVMRIHDAWAKRAAKPWWQFW